MTSISRCYEHRNHWYTLPADCSTCQRINVERTIVVMTVEALLKAGYMLNVNNGGDEDELPQRTNHPQTLLAAMMETDEERLHIYSAGGWGVGEIDFVYGNDGYDVISNYTTNIESILNPVMDWINVWEDHPSPLVHGCPVDAPARVMPSTTDSLVQTIITLQAERDHLAAKLDTLQSKWNRVIESITP